MICGNLKLTFSENKMSNLIYHCDCVIYSTGATFDFHRHTAQLDYSYLWFYQYTAFYVYVFITNYTLGFNKIY